MAKGDAEIIGMAGNADPGGNVYKPANPDRGIDH